VSVSADDHFREPKQTVDSVDDPMRFERDVKVWNGSVPATPRWKK
jgi:hypothetical protein